MSDIDASYSIDDPISEMPNVPPDPITPVPDPSSPEPAGSGNGGTHSPGAGSVHHTEGKGSNGDHAAGSDDTHSGSVQGEAGNHVSGDGGARRFISYMATNPNEEETDPDDLDYEARMALEDKAIMLILASEPQLHRTPPFNPGYDLFESDEEGITRLIEVKAMTNSLRDRPVGLSRAQFECAREHGEEYWLYVVEYAGNPQAARIVRIQDPAGKIRTFTFDYGWLTVAIVENRGNVEH